MEVRWTENAHSDVERLYDFLAPVNPEAATKVVQRIVATGPLLSAQPRLGEPLEEFNPREVRRLIVGGYEIRYEIVDQILFIIRLWHTREER